MTASQTYGYGNKGVLLVSIIWLVALCAAAVVATMNGASVMGILPYFGAAILPALLGVVLYPFMERDWARMAIIFAWIALAIAASLAIAFVPMAILFLCAPAAAALFRREMVIEAMVLSAIAAGFVYYAHKFGYGSQLDLPSDFTDWGRSTAPAATIVFMIGAMFAAANSREAPPELASTVRTDADILNAYPGAAFRTDDEGNILYASDGAHRLLGTTSRSVSGLALANILTNSEVPNDLIAYTLDDVQLSGRSQSIEVDALLMDADVEARRRVRLDIAPTSGDGAYAYMHDIETETSRIRSLEAAQNVTSQEAVQDSADKSLFFAGVSHELRTPLNAIIGFSDMMRSRLFGPLPGKYAEYADLIHDSGQHMLDLIGDVLDISKIEAGKYELTYDTFDLADVVRSSAKMIRPSADAAHVTLDVEIDSAMPVLLRADRRAVRQILLNLMSNAIKFTSKGGRVVVGAGSMGERINFTVKDNGSGMSEAELERIGEPYAQGASAAMSDQRGSGLGLSLVKSLVDLHAGDFSVASKLGDGTTVSIDLPNPIAD